MMNHIIIDQNEKTMPINKALNDLAVAPTLESVCESIMSAIKELVGVDKAIMVVHWQGNRVQHIVKVLGLFDAFGINTYRGNAVDDAAQIVIRIGDCVKTDAAAQWVIGTGRPLQKKDFNGVETCWSVLIDNWLAMPLNGKSGPFGILVIEDLDSKKTESLLAFFYQTSVFLENILLFEDRVAVNEKLSEAHKKLQDLDHQKSEFLSMVAHDLRTPLASIKSYADLLLMYKDESSDVREEFLITIKKETDRLARLINDFLDLSRIESGTINYLKSPFNINELFHHFVLLYQGEANHRHIRLEYEIDPDLPEPVADKDRIGQVLANLMSNAVKFTPDFGRIKVNAQALDAQTITVSVEDNGPGVDAKHQRLIFDKFGQVADRTAKAKGGTGLGLAIAKEIVEYHGGRLWVESEPGHGARFIFTLPVSQTQYDCSYWISKKYGKMNS